MSISILGLNFHHADASACLLIDGKLIAAVAEERFSRIKRDSSFPINSIKNVLSYANLKFDDIDYIAYSRDESANYFNKLLYGIKNFNTAFEAFKEHKRRESDTKKLEVKIANLLGIECFKNKTKLIKVEHHLCHGCSSYFNSNFDKSLVFNSDASGDFVSMSIYLGVGNKLKLLDKTFLPNSLGMFYSAMTQLIGFKGYGDEFKLMGLSAYGENVYYDFLKKIFIKNNKGLIKTRKGYINMHSGGKSGKKTSSETIKTEILFSKKLEDFFGPPPNDCKNPGNREKNIASSTQKLFEELTLNKIKKYSHYSENISLAGGCSLNGLVNTRIAEDLGLNNQFVQPASTDDGTAIGAAFYVWNIFLNKRSRFYMENCFLGIEYGLTKSDLKYIEKKNYKIVEHCSVDSTINSAALAISNNEVIGWFQGRSEWGPRALGNRSILTNPANPNAKELINRKIKRRESFRPFAPSVLDEFVQNYFETNLTSPFMNHVVKVRKEFIDILKATTHVDGSARIQTVNKKNNPLYYKLINKVKSYTKFPIVLNTSFNENEPIVEKPMEAFATFERTKMDRVYIGNIEVRRNKD
tara:strand:- start:1636 stop:3381 length:1746 start_codon:yes stop_codon:yes gene_type:complete